MRPARSVLLFGVSMSVPFALSSAVAYGGGDFAGGLAARRAPVLVVTAVAQAAGVALLLPAVVLVPGAISTAALGIGALAGVCGMAGLLFYMRGLAAGPMGLVAPVSSVIGAGLPLAVGVLGGERPGAVAGIALVVALAAIALAGAGSRGDAAASTGLLYGMGAGVGFGLFFVAIAKTPPDAGLWSLVAGRVTSLTLLVVLLLARRRSVGRPVGVRMMVLCGLLDTAANVLFLFATRTGALSISGVLVSLYPAVVLVLARVVLGERLTGLQLTGVGLAMTASAMLAA